jgi:hypothetical protein
MTKIELLSMTIAHAYEMLDPKQMILVQSEPSEWFDKLKPLESMLLNIVKPRNYGFHKKYFALLDFAFEQWQPEATYKGMIVQKNSDTFRKEMIILAGCYDVVCSLGTNEVKKVAKSMSFAKMSEEEFNNLFDRTKDVVWNRIFANEKHYTREEFDNVVNQLMGF